MWLFSLHRIWSFQLIRRALYTHTKQITRAQQKNRRNMPMDTMERKKNTYKIQWGNNGAAAVSGEITIGPAKLSSCIYILFVYFIWTKTYVNFHTLFAPSSLFFFIIIIKYIIIIMVNRQRSRNNYIEREKEKKVITKRRRRGGGKTAEITVRQWFSGKQNERNYHFSATQMHQGRSESNKLNKNDVDGWCRKRRPVLVPL